MLRDEIREYRQPDGLITPSNQHPGVESVDQTGNGLLYASLYHILLVRRGESIPDDVLAFEDIVHPCYGIPGILNRSPTKRDDQEGRDDYVGVIAASRYLKTRDAYIILNAGNKRRFLLFKWFYKNNNPGQFKVFSKETWKAWFGRYPSFIAFMQWAGGDIIGGITPHIFRRLWLTVELLLSSLNRNPDPSAVILRWLQVDAIMGRDWLTDVGCHVWLGAIGPDAMKKALTEHLGVSHPIARYWV